ncbi:hypothetical protein F511_30847 [Dorcoceras hygrometricum]|uniref:CCHC-type domain-containing protein n=1 Tax=Dorcoceras hygrometricum TaxID=472368 RepID=A0A2Z7DEF6_9LAMI|nr:hypothetical protein F511_30847 [Dorcoceras hygrometricum]
MVPRSRVYNVARCISFPRIVNPRATVVGAKAGQVRTGWTWWVVQQAGSGQVHRSWAAEGHPRHKSRKTKYEVKPQYEELSKQLNMQHAINQCYECMRAIKGRISRPLGSRRSNPAVTTPMIALDYSGTTHQSASRNVTLNQGHSSSSGSVSSGSGSGSGSGSRGGFYSQCGGRHETSQCRGVRGLCHLCGQPGHFARACPSIGGRSTGQSQQGSASGSSQRQQPFAQSQRSGFQPREPSHFGGPSRC